MTCSTRGNAGTTTTTTVIHRPANSSRMPGITRATSITRRRGGPTNRQQLLAVLAITLLVGSLFTLILLALHRSRECAKETRKFLLLYFILFTYSISIKVKLLIIFLFEKSLFLSQKKKKEQKMLDVS